ncbi:hypothetical protein Mal15_61210 [Stieleria maiorica]|uniref:Lipocalin-like domain-containing protein n=1 Tax=Stieleria maiorica TaxID=2795974 RepID=A0A5B9MSP4_9BACT|nr:hypothetical protein [Stieleria maiorica]QEG02038.1 hypothetical protein Mal15_61210 [Stieleria maiorica]
MYRFLFAVVFVWVPVSFMSLVAVGQVEESQPADAGEPTVGETIKGEWVLYRETPNGKYMTIKVHRGDHTVVTTYDPNKHPIQSHRSEYRIDTSGAVPVFRYRNKVVLVGPNAGAKDERESAYIFRIDGDRFYEVHGMLPDDKGKPSLMIWQRLKDNPIPKDEA